MSIPPGPALITGASSGIGTELARLFAAEGHDLVLVARRADRLQSLADELAGAHGVSATILQEDLTEPSAPARIFEALAGRGLAIGTLVNNAGFGLRGRMVKLPLDRQLAMIDLNIRALTELTLRALPAMVGRRSGAVMNVASLAGFLPGPGLGIYHATKAYVLSFSEALAEEVGPKGVTVTALCPGPTATEFQSVSGGAGYGGTIVRSMSAADVARSGFDGLRAGHTVVVPGPVNKAVTALPRLLPRALVRKLVGLNQSRK